MAFGLQTINNLNQIQIDGSFSAMTVHSTGVAANNSYLTVPENCILMARPLVAEDLISGVSTNSSGQVWINCAGGIEYVLITKIEAPPAESYGIQIFGETGNFIATSNKKVFIADGVYEVGFSGLSIPAALTGLDTPEFGKRYVSINNGITAIRAASPSVSNIAMTALTLDLSEQTISFGLIDGGILAGAINIDFTVNRAILTGYFDI